MEAKKLWVCSVVAFLGMLSAATAFAAEALRIMGTKVEFPPPSGCIYLRSPAHNLSTASAASLMIAVGTIIVAVKSAIRHHGNSDRTLMCSVPQNSDRALFCCIASMFTYTIALFLLILGAAPYGHVYIHDNCFAVKPGAFAGGAVLSLATVVFGVITYLTVTSILSGIHPIGVPASPSQGGSAMGQPQIPPLSHDPVLVHQDTPL